MVSAELDNITDQLTCEELGHLQRTMAIQRFYSLSVLVKDPKHLRKDFDGYRLAGRA